MFISKTLVLSFVFLYLLVSCQGLKESEYQKNRKKNTVAECIYRMEGDEYFAIQEPQYIERQRYSWEEVYIGDIPKINKEFFRCRGDAVNQAYVLKNKRGEPERITDCVGKDRHSLPIINDKENIYPALIEILNFIQKESGRKVIITCGHRCPMHNRFSDPSNYNRTSKHMVGAEVDFYLEGLENKPEKVIELIMLYYNQTIPFAGKKAYEYFERYEKEDTNVSTYPRYNKEVFVKSFKADEGRDKDNDHSFPYISIQVRSNRDDGKRVTYTWEQAFYGFYRY